MFKIAVASLALLAIAVKGQDDGFLRQLQSSEPLQQSSGSKKAKKFYGPNTTIPFNANLGCGGCIRGGYIYCLPGALGSSRSSWPAGNPSVCCKDANSCPQLTNTKYNCSNQFVYSKAAQLSVCPFEKYCGGNQTYEFSNIGSQQNLTVSIPEGETCTFKIKTRRGVPAFKPNNTNGFDISVLDYDDDDLASQDARILQALSQPSSSQNSQNQQRGNNTKNQSRDRDDDDKPRNVSQKIKPVKVNRNDTKDNDENGPDGVRTGTRGKKGEPIVGPQEGFYDPTSQNNSDYKFKGGKHNGAKDSIDKPRYQQISITAIGSLDTSARMLQSVVNGQTYWTMDLTMGSTDFADAGAIQQMVVSLAALFIGFISMNL